MLKLRKILIQGFKSFADKTELAFEGNGVTAIVGPNGCGKSNISDAIAWVLGEQSAKSLRGGRMEDVIFSGTRSRLPVGLSEVTLTLMDPEVLREANAPYPRDAAGFADESLSENSAAAEASETAEDSTEHSQTIAIGAPAAVATRRKKRPKFRPKPGELVVSRRLFRSGESEYLINGRQVRLRDVQDIFLGTGLGPDSYAIIEQGRVGLILSSKPSDRRSIIEEAAGITKFKSKRKLAESKLEQAKQNLLRINDITEEVSKQLASLKRQASKARRYSELRGRMRALSRNLFNARFRSLTALLQQNEQTLDEVSKQYQEKHQQIENEEGLYRQNNASILVLESQLKDLREQLAQINLEADRGQQRIQFQKQQLQGLTVRSLENTQEIEQLSHQEQLHRHDIESKNQSLQEATQNYGRINTDYELQNSLCQALQTEVLDLESSIEQSRSRLLICVEKGATLRNQLLQLGEIEKRLEQQIIRLADERDEASIHQQESSLAYKSFEQQRQQDQEQLIELNEQISLLSDALQVLAEEEARSHQQLTVNKEQFSSLTNRLKSLQELATHHAYSTESVRLLLAVAMESPDSGFQTPGILADLIEVDPAYEAAIEEFLKQELEFLLVPSASEAAEGISLLRKTGAGRSTFLLCSNGQTSTDEELGTLIAELRASEPSLVSLNGIIRFPESYNKVVREALPYLSLAFITESYKRASELAHQHPQLIFLTPQGEFFRSRLISGGGKAPGGHLSLKREIRELDSKTAVLQKEISEQEKGLQLLRESAHTQQLAFSENRHKAQDLEKALLSSDLHLKQIQTDLERASQRQNLAVRELQRTEEERAEVQARHSELETEIAATEAQKGQIESFISTQQSHLKELKDRSTQDAQSLTELHSKLATFGERKQAAEAELTRLTAALEDTLGRMSRLESQKENWLNQTRDIEQSIQMLDESLFSQAVQKASLEADIRSKDNDLAQFRFVQTGLDESLRLQRTGLEEIQNRKTSLEIERARFASDLSHLEETCLKELATTLENLCNESPVHVEEIDLNQLNLQYQDLTIKIEAMGPVNMMALEEYEQCDQRFQFLAAQRQDLLDSIEDTTAALREIDQVSREQFREAFAAINANFYETFQSLFGGGRGEMKLLDEQDEIESGIEIIAQPPGKRLQNVLLLSGGEKALTAIALLLAIFKFQPSPFCVLDEVDAPLDEVNTARFSQMIRMMSRETQFVLITHSKKTMEIADTLYGVTMQEPGVSDLVSVQFQ